MPVILVNPSDEARRMPSKPAPRLESLAGSTIALLDISKSGGRIFLDRLEQLLKDRYGVSNVIRAAKPTFTKPAPVEVMDRLMAASPDAVIEALAD
jgi:hypothetical protein